MHAGVLHFYGIVAKVNMPLSESKSLKGFSVMDFSKYSGMELIQLYGELISKMREDNLIRSKNVTGDLGEYIVVDYYTKTRGLPKLQFAPPSTKNIDAISVNGERYSIKCITTNTTGAFYGIEKDADINSLKPLFEYVVIIKLNENYQPDYILELDWETFFRHKHWHSRIRAYNLVITSSVIEDGKMVYKRDLN